MLADLARSIAPSPFTVVSLLNPGADPHLYQPAPSDARTLASAAIIVRNGLHLEGWIDDLLGNAEAALLVTASAPITPITDPASGGVDPHIWFDAELWAQVALHVASELATHPDSAEVAPEIVRRGRDFAARARVLDAWARACIATVPEAHRVLVTSHDAFAYYGRAYGLEVVAVQGVSTEQEASHRDVAAVIEVVNGRRVPAVFVETSVNRALVEQVAAQTGAVVRGPLYSDSTGEPGSGAETWAGMFAANTIAIATALGGQCTAPQP